MGKTSSKSLHTYTETKHHPRANKFQSKTYHTNSPATQELQYTGFNIQAAQSHTKPIDISKLTTGHFIALQREEIQPTHQSTNASFPNQETLTSHSSNPTHSKETLQ